MKNNLLFQFDVDREQKTIRIKREFAADLPLVWQAWTTPEFLEQWIAPKPWRAETKTMDFREGGHWHYAMVGPQGEKHWSRYDYLEIVPQVKIMESRGFSDENGAMNPDFPTTLSTTLFFQKEGRTLVELTAVYGSLDVLEYMVTHGFKEGMDASLANLDELLEKSSNG